MWSVRTLFDDSHPLDRSSDFNTLIANTFAYKLAGMESDYTVYYAGAPTMYYYGHANLPFLAPDSSGIDVAEPWSLKQTPPVLRGPTLFFFVPDRAGEVTVIRNWFPGGEMTEVRDDNGIHLYTTYVPAASGQDAPI